MALIHELMTQVMEEVGAIPKNGKVPVGGKSYSYRSIDHVLLALHPVLIKHKICTSLTVDEITATATQEVTAKDTTRTLSRTVCRVTVTFFAADGSSMQSSALGEGVDYSGDKASAKAVSMGTKYAIGHGLCIPYEDAADPDRDQPASPPADKPKTPSLSQMISGEPAPTALATTANEPDPRTDAMEVNVNDPCLPHQRAKVIELWEKLGRTKEQLREAIAKKGKAKLADLTVAEASDFIEALCKKLNIANCPF